MFSLFSSSQVIGLERSTNQTLAASLQWQGRQPQFKLFSLTNQDNVKQLYIDHPILVTGLAGYDVLVRSLTIPLVKTADIQAALAFQAEPLLPYSIDQALLSYQLISQTSDSSTLTLLATQQDCMQAHLESWQAQQIESEIVSTVPTALAQFGMYYHPTEQPFIIIHIQSDTLVGVLIKDKKLIASFAQRGGLDTFLTNSSSELLQKQIAKIGYSLFKELNGELLEGILLTGSIVEQPAICEQIAQSLHWPLLSCVSTPSYSSQELQAYAVPIGLALGASQAKGQVIDFRQQTWSYPHAWMRLKQPLMIYGLMMLLLTTVFYFFGQVYLRHQEHQLRQAYVDLLANRNKLYDQFELAFLDKNAEAKEKFDGEVVSVERFNRQDLLERLEFFQKEIQSTPDTFPLVANTPRASDVLAWLSQHPIIAYEDESGHRQTHLQLENFSYIMVKRPVLGKKQEKYQVKVELEFSSLTPKSAREFHDALIAPNDWVDPKSEVKWSSNRGKYKTSFYLKDKTTYLNL